MSVAQAQRDISSAEFVEWIAYDALEPGEPERNDYRAALIACTIANTARTKKTQAFKMKDFLLKFNAPKVSKDVDQRELRTKFLAWKAAHEAARASRSKRKQK